MKTIEMSCVILDWRLSWIKLCTKLLFVSLYCTRARNSQSVIFPVIFDVTELAFRGHRAK